MIGVTIETPDFNDYKANVMPRAITDALVASGQKWIKQELPRRFAVGAARRYGWPPRTRAYMLRKAKQKGHQRDMEFHGTLKRTALGGAIASAMRRTVSVKIMVPVTDTEWKSSMTLRQQMRRTNTDDAKMMLDESGRDLVRRLAEDPKYRIKRKRARKL